MTNVSTPPTLKELALDARVSLLSRDRLIAFPHYWQLPAATEKAAFESIQLHLHELNFDYFGFPWATVIDGLRSDAATVWPILMALRKARSSVQGCYKRVTVAQHIHAMQFIDLFKACGITDIFWSHARYDQTELQGIKLHPFPLFPAQTQGVVPSSDINTSRRYLANFVGAYNPKVYLSNVRDIIFSDQNIHGDLLIIKRDKWHFDRTVYEEQIAGCQVDKKQLDLEAQRAKEYINTIQDSWFTLCPTGSGPNSIRLYESLCLGSIPIILTKKLRLPGDISLWKRAVLIEEDSESGYLRALTQAREMGLEKRILMLKAGIELFNFVNPQNYGKLILNTISEIN